MLRFVTAGESHGRAVIGVIESFPAGFALSREEIDHQLTRRRGGYGRGPRMRLEQDRVQIISGVRRGKTLGSPITLLVANKDWKNWRAVMNPEAASSARRSGEVLTPRPGHADLAGAVKYDTHDIRNVLERASARETAARVACGAVARQLLEYFHIRIASHVVAIGPARLGRGKYDFADIAERAEQSPVRCLDSAVSQAMMTEIRKARMAKDTLGGIFEVRAANLPLGLGSNAQWFMRLDGALAAAVMSIPSVKGVEIGEGFAVARRRGSQVHDSIGYDPIGGDVRTKYFFHRGNTAGGLEGGMTNGAELIIRAACKPIATLKKPLVTVNLRDKTPSRALVERADVCVIPAAAVVAEAMVALVLASAFTDVFGNDSLHQIETNFAAYLQREF